MKNNSPNDGTLGFVSEAWPVDRVRQHRTPTDIHPTIFCLTSRFLQRSRLIEGMQESASSANMQCQEAGLTSPPSWLLDSPGG